MELQRISGCKTENVVSKTLKHSVFYHYDAEGNLTKKRYIADDKETVYSIEHKEDGAQIYTLPNGVVSHSKTDHLGRLEFDELQLGKVKQFEGTRKVMKTVMGANMGNMMKGAMRRRR